MNNTRSLKTAQLQLDRTPYLLKEKKFVIFLKRVDIELQLLRLLDLEAWSITALSKMFIMMFIPALQALLRYFLKKSLISSNTAFVNINCHENFVVVF